MVEFRVVGSNDDGPSGSGPWQLDSPHQRYFRKEGNKSETESFTGRFSSFHLRRIEEIIHTRIEPDFKTKTDIVQDAISMWLEDWDQRHPDGVGGEYTSSSQLDIIQAQSDRRANYLDKAKKTLDTVASDKDIAGLKAVVVSFVKYLEESHAAPAAYQLELEALIAKARRMLGEFEKSE